MGLTLKIQDQKNSAVLELSPLFESELDNPDDFKRFASYVLQAVHISPFDTYAYTLLPLVNTLSSKWLAQSAPGQEFTTPPVGWEFKERMAMSLKHPTELPILVIKDADGMPLEQLIERISSDIFDAYGLRVANVTRTKTSEPVWLDDGLSI